MGGSGEARPGAAGEGQGWHGNCSLDCLCPYVLFTRK